MQEHVPLVVFAGFLERETQCGRHSQRRILDTFSNLIQPDVELSLDLGEDGFESTLFRGEVVIERSRRDVCTLRDFCDGNVIVSALADNRTGGIQ